MAITEGREERRGEKRESRGSGGNEKGGVARVKKPAIEATTERERAKEKERREKKQVGGTTRTPYSFVSGCLHTLVFRRGLVPAVRCTAGSQSVHRSNSEYIHGKLPKGCKGDVSVRASSATREHVRL